MYNLIVLSFENVSPLFFRNMIILLTFCFILSSFFYFYHQSSFYYFFLLNHKSTCFISSIFFLLFTKNKTEFFLFAYFKCDTNMWIISAVLSHLPNLATLFHSSVVLPIGFFLLFFFSLFIPCPNSLLIFLHYQNCVNFIFSPVFFVLFLLYYFFLFASLLSSFFLQFFISSFIMSRNTQFFSGTSYISSSTLTKS